MSASYQSTSQKDFWKLAAATTIAATILASGIAVSNLLGNVTGSIWVSLVLGFGVGAICSSIRNFMISRLLTPIIVADSDQAGRKRYYNSPLITVLAFGLLSSFYIFNPFSNAIGQPDYAKAFIGGVWLLLAFDQFRLWYKNRKVD